MGVREMALAMAIRQTSNELPSRVGQIGLRSIPAAVMARPRQAANAADEVIAELDRASTTLNFSRGQTVVENGAAALHVFKVSRGTLRAVRLLPDGRRYIA